MYSRLMAFSVALVAIFYLGHAITQTPIKDIKVTAAEKRAKRKALQRLTAKDKLKSKLSRVKTTGGFSHDDDDDDDDGPSFLDRIRSAIGSGSAASHLQRSINSRTGKKKKK